jgi:hypothetical protein
MRATIGITTNTNVDLGAIRFINLAQAVPAAFF